MKLTNVICCTHAEIAILCINIVWLERYQIVCYPFWVEKVHSHVFGHLEYRLAVVEGKVYLFRNGPEVDLDIFDVSINIFDWMAG